MLAGLLACVCVQPCRGESEDGGPVPGLLRPVWQDEACSRWVDSVMAGMDLKERLGQLLVYTIAPQPTDANRELLRKVVEDYKVGGLLFSGGFLRNQAVLTNEAQRLAKVPLMITFDGEWGLGMRLKDTPSYPRNMVLGCIRNDSLLRAYGREVARQCREMGVNVNFAPDADVNINPRNPVINTRSFGELPSEVARRVLAYAAGLEEGGVLSVSKHFPGHGDTETDSHHSLPHLSFTRARLDSVELYPFRKVVEAGLGGIMVGHLEVPALEPRKGIPTSLSDRVVDGLLKEEMGFQGLVFTDALNMKGAGTSSTLCLQALKAGNDMLLVPSRIKEEVQHILRAVEKGELPRGLIDAKCRKVLTWKYALGLRHRPQIRLDGLESRINTAGAENLRRRLMQEAVTVAAMRDSLLPLDTVSAKIAVLNVGGTDAFQPFYRQLTTYTGFAEFRLRGGMDAAARKKLLRSLAGYPYLLVCVDDSDLSGYKAVLSDLPSDVPLIYLCFAPGKRLLPLVQAVKKADAVVLAHSDEDAVQRHVARMLYGDASATGRLSASIGTLFPAGAGCDVKARRTSPSVTPDMLGLNPLYLDSIGVIACQGIAKGAYPGCQVVVLKDGQTVYDRAFGTYTGKGSSPVTPSSVYDLASLTKTTGTLLAVMKLYDEGRINLSDRIGLYLPFLRGTDKQDITLRQLLLHESGLPSTILFYQEAIDEESFDGPLFRGRRDASHTARIGRQTWANARFRYRNGLISDVPGDGYTMQVCDSFWLKTSFKDEYLRQIADAPLLSKRYRYSCVGFILLQQIVETLTSMPLDTYLDRTFYAPMGLSHTTYLPLRRMPQEVVVPSARDPFLRKCVLQGFVHDESAAFQGGVSGNAGLFSTAREVACIYQMLLDGGLFKGHRYLSESTCRLFTTTVSRISRRGLGFDKPDKKVPRRSPCAPSAPASVYGHTGFTGTCAWADPENRLVFVFLCNRTYPDPWNNKLSQLDLRPRMQEMIYKSLIGG